MSRPDYDRLMDGLEIQEGMVDPYQVKKMAARIRANHPEVPMRALAEIVTEAALMNMVMERGAEFSVRLYVTNLAIARELRDGEDQHGV